MSDAFPLLFSPFHLGTCRLRNRICVAPTTRQVAEADGTPTSAMRDYWVSRVRRGAALVFTEGVYFTDHGGCKGYPHQSGICNERHEAAWGEIAQAIHDAGGRCILQLQHAGRLADPLFLAEGEQPRSASDTHAPGYVIFTDSEQEKELRGWDHLPYRSYLPARALTRAEIHEIADEFAEAAVRAVRCGFDGVEVHGANGFLIDQFFNARVNRRTDEFGGTPARRSRFAILVCQRVREALGPAPVVTLRLSQDRIDGIHEAYPGGVAEAREIARTLREAPVDGLHWASFAWDDNRDPGSDEIIPQVLREESGKPLIVNGGVHDGAVAEHILATDVGDLIAVGRPFFANPDWVERVRSGEPQQWRPFHRRYVVHPEM